jgi:hypothetical protein
MTKTLTRNWLCDWVLVTPNTEPMQYLSNLDEVKGKLIIYTTLFKEAAYIFKDISMKTANQLGQEYGMTPIKLN